MSRFLHGDYNGRTSKPANNEIVQIIFEFYPDERSTEHSWSVRLGLGEKWLCVEANGE